MSRNGVSPGLRRIFDARPDTVDFRDRMFRQTLVEVPTRITLEDYMGHGVPVLNQGHEGACTGFGLATVAHYLLRTRKREPDLTIVSPKMFYDMARRYDEWPGERYQGSNARAAMKGWHKHGVCSARHWPYHRRAKPDLFAARFDDALQRPLGAYFRVNHRDIIAMHAAIAEVGILYAAAQVHEGWIAKGQVLEGSEPYKRRSKVTPIRQNGVIAFDRSAAVLGGHAFAIVGYDEDGFWIQNSWGESWGTGGFGHLSYADWLANGSDVWVARLGAPVNLTEKRRAGIVTVGGSAVADRSCTYTFSDLRTHIISIGDDGRLSPDGTYGTSPENVLEIFDNVGRWMSAEPDRHRRVLLYVPSGLAPADTYITKFADMRAPLLRAGIYPLSVLWKTDFWRVLKEVLAQAIAQRKPETPLDSSQDFMLDRLDDALEAAVRIIGGKARWDEVRRTALLAGRLPGGLPFVLAQLAALRRRHRWLQIHLVGHSAGAIMLCSLISRMPHAGENRLSIESCTLWAPACTIEDYRRHLLPAIESGTIKSFTLFTLTDRAEQADHCARIYHKSLLYLISNALGSRLHRPTLGPFDEGGEPLLGMQKFVQELDGAERPLHVIQSPNGAAPGSSDASRATTHGGFDDDPDTLRATLARILGRRSIDAAFRHHRSAASRRARRQSLP